MSDPSASKPTLTLGVGLTDDHSSNKLTGAKIIPLTAPDSDSNYSDWEYQMLTLLENYNVDYVLKPIQPEARPPNWERDNKANPIPHPRRQGLRLLPQISREGLRFLLGSPVLTLNATQKSHHQQLPPSPIFL
ncbi:hypothetical protein PCASD_23527 [Puccinia coronata f. sp. avenae]|uniref:Uncharacterized protein n=1 Tax=Puccinia coronata f. sp. avenae TaxID=200324 RepID=A0A2N5S0W7_9BASI|nr:hypothetical protein PCASD_23527 [Puccinia coronata f. sp. avenae]